MLLNDLNLTNDLSFEMDYWAEMSNRLSSQTCILKFTSVVLLLLQQVGKVMSIWNEE